MKAYHALLSISWFAFSFNVFAEAPARQASEAPPKVAAQVSKEVPTKTQEKAVEKAPVKVADAPATPAAKAPEKAAEKAPAKVAVAPAKPAVKAPEKAVEKAPAKVAAAPAKPAAKAPVAKDFDVAKAAAKVDGLVSAMLKQQKITPNEPVDDATFVRRVYLDIIGRIPTIEEAENFHGSNYERKRPQLIADLLDSEGHMSHAYNYWADILRINAGLGIGATQAEAAYQLWVKESIRQNKPYDQFVRELVSARGMIWENGAVGYYLRDRGMPLDNMSSTIRAFLGVRLECAQCHNHPFDEWTQMDYFQMAAFSYGMEARAYDSDNRRALSEQQSRERNEAIAKATGDPSFPLIRNQKELDGILADAKRLESLLKRTKLEKEAFRKTALKSIKAYEEYEQSLRVNRVVMNEMYTPLRNVRTRQVEKALKLPHDYSYDDAKPNQAVTARTMFGEEIDLANIDDTVIDAYASWMTSKNNPTFTRVIANRLWKRVFGHGVFEPVDELTDTTAISNPELLAYLEDLMKELNYDMRKYQEVLYNTKAYQRAANTEEMVMGEHYYFAGPLLRRMSAEQIWDSIVALALPEADGYRPRLKNQLASIEKAKRINDALEERTEEEYLAMVKEVTDIYTQVAPGEEEYRQKAADALNSGDKAGFEKYRAEINKLRATARKALDEIAYKNTGKQVDGMNLLAAMGMSEMQMDSTTMMGSSSMMDASSSMMSSSSMEAQGGERAVLIKLPKPKMPEPPADLDKDKRRAWMERQRADYNVYTSLVSQMARASELESPARRGHFLREFGQSDREVTENSAANASVPQALNLLNGPMVDALTNRFSVFGHRIHAAGDTDEKIKMIFQAMLTREPSEHEMKIAREEIEAEGEKAIPGLVWALLNTQRFLFVQ